MKSAGRTHVTTVRLQSQAAMKMRRVVQFLMVGLRVVGSGIEPIWGQNVPPIHLSMATSQRWGKSGRWPTKGTAALREYVGPEACTRCHAEIAASQQQTPMFQAASRTSDSAVLQQRPELSNSQTRPTATFYPGEECKVIVLTG